MCALGAHVKEDIKVSAPVHAHERPPPPFLSLTQVHAHSLSVVWLEQTGSAAGQPVPLHISVIHPCHSGQDHEGGVVCWVAGKERPAWLTFNCHTVALCSPIASSRGPSPPFLTYTQFFPSLPPQPRGPSPCSSSMGQC